MSVSRYAAGDMAAAARAPGLAGAHTHWPDPRLVARYASAAPVCTYIFCDGASRRVANSSSWRGGVGVHCGDNDPRNVSESHFGSEATVGRMEALAVLRALEIVSSSHWPGPVIIHSDSESTVQALTDRCGRWMSNNWCTEDGMPVRNADVFQAAYNHYRHRVLPVSIEWISRDSNSAADALAKAAAGRASEDTVSPPVQRISAPLRLTLQQLRPQPATLAVASALPRSGESSSMVPRPSRFCSVL